MASFKDGGLTGKSRYRSGLGGKLILQVEIHRCNSDELFNDRWYTGWRDARVEDLNVIEVKPILQCEQ